MQTIPIQAIPNQSFSIVLDNNQWNFIIKATNGIMSISLTLNNNIVMENMRAVANEKIIPSEYEEAGNFIFLTQNFEIPDYTQFGVTQLLVYVSAAELVVLRAEPTLPITATDFDPIAALPLRFAPEGYIENSVVLLEGSSDGGLLEGSTTDFIAVE